MLTAAPTAAPANAAATDMPPMTMVFVAADPAMLDRVKPGDKVRFAADKVGDVYRVTRIEPVK